MLEIISIVIYQLNFFNVLFFISPMTEKISFEITEEDISRFSTIEHDYQIIKDRFNNYKFALIERESKMLFLESIRNNVEADYLPIFNESKNRLQDVKSAGVMLKEEIKELSIENHELKKELESISIDYEKLESLKKKFASIEKDFHSEEEINNLQEEYSKVCESARGMVIELEKLKEEIEKLDNENDNNYLVHLKEKMEELKRKKKRWSRVEYEKMLVDAYRWYDMMIGISEMVFGTIGDVVVKKNGFDMSVFLNSVEIVIMVRNGAFVGVRGIETDWSKDLARWCVRLESPCLFVLMAKRYLN